MADAFLPSSPKLVPAIPEVITDGRDEMHLAEWPIALVASNGKQPTSVNDPNTLVFRDTVRHPKTGQLIERTFTVSATGKWGLPGPADDEVLLALIQLSRFADFSSRKLYFTRYHLLLTLGWPTNGIYYERLKQALKRLEGVQLDFERAYWSEEAQSWEDRTFNLYNDLRILEEENSTSKKPDPRQPTFPAFCCELTWSQYLFQSLNSRAVKHLDFELYRSLGSAIAKRLFRFLDKRLYNERHACLRMPLDVFAISHVGLAPGQPQREYKRRLKVGLAELEEKGLIKRMKEAERFRKLKRGLYEIIIERALFENAAQPKLTPGERLPRMALALAQAGMHQEQAIKIAKTRSESDIRQKLDIFRWRLETGDPPDKPGAWLNDQFRNNYPEPDGYLAHLKAKETKRAKEEVQKALVATKLEQNNLIQAATKKFEAAFDSWWAGLSEKGRADVDQTIRNKQHNEFEKRYLNEGEISSPGRSLWKFHRQRAFCDRTGTKPPEGK